MFEVLAVVSIMSITVEQLNEDQAEKIVGLEEGQYLDVKSIDITPGNLSKTISAFANTDGGDLYIGISEVGREKDRDWAGFSDQEAANGHLQIFEKLFPLGADYIYEFLSCEVLEGLVLHVQVNKSGAIAKASNQIPYIRRGAQSLPQEGIDELRRLEFAKGLTTFESETVNVSKDVVVASETVRAFIREVVPSTKPESWLRKQQLIRYEKPTVAGLVLFADEPQASLPKHCGVKVYRYKTQDVEGTRETMDFTPKTVEGHLYSQIRESVRVTNRDC